MASPTAVLPLPPAAEEAVKSNRTQHKRSIKPVLSVKVSNKNESTINVTSRRGRANFITEPELDALQPYPLGLPAIQLQDEVDFATFAPTRRAVDRHKRLFGLVTEDAPQPVHTGTLKRKMMGQAVSPTPGGLVSVQQTIEVVVADDAEGPLREMLKKAQAGTADGIDELNIIMMDSDFNTLDTALVSDSLPMMQPKHSNYMDEDVSLYTSMLVTCSPKDLDMTSSSYASPMITDYEDEHLENASFPIGNTDVDMLLDEPLGPLGLPIIGCTSLEGTPISPNVTQEISMASPTYPATPLLVLPSIYKLATPSQRTAHIENDRPLLIDYIRSATKTRMAQPLKQADSPFTTTSTSSSFWASPPALRPPSPYPSQVPVLSSPSTHSALLPALELFGRHSSPRVSRKAARCNPYRAVKRSSKKSSAAISGIKELSLDTYAPSSNFTSATSSGFSAIQLVDVTNHVFNGSHKRKRASGQETQSKEENKWSMYRSPHAYGPYRDIPRRQRVVRQPQEEDQNLVLKEVDDSNDGSRSPIKPIRIFRQVWNRVVQEKHALQATMVIEALAAFDKISITNTEATPVSV